VWRGAIYSERRVWIGVRIAERVRYTAKKGLCSDTGVGALYIEERTYCAMQDKVGSGV